MSDGTPAYQPPGARQWMAFQIMVDVTDHDTEALSDALEGLLCAGHADDDATPCKIESLASCKSGDYHDVHRWLVGDV